MISWIPQRDQNQQGVRAIQSGANSLLEVQAKWKVAHNPTKQQTRELPSTLEAKVTTIFIFKPGIPVLSDIFFAMLELF